jgi:Reverse transcriptase (RNA-dependent DNA polymerase)
MNGISERGIRIITECLRSIFEYSKAPKDLWPELMIGQIHTTNRTILSTLDGKTLYKVFCSDILCRLRTNAPTLCIPDVSHLRVLGGKVIAYINKESPRRVQSEKFYSHGTEGILVGYEGNRIYRCKLEGRPDIVRVSSIRFEEGSEEFADSNPLEVFDIPNLLDDSIDHSLSFETSKLLQASEHGTADETKESHSFTQNTSTERRSASSDSNASSTLDTIVVDHTLVPDTLVQGPPTGDMPPPRPRGRPITRSQPIPRTPSNPVVSTTSAIPQRITRSQSTATSTQASAFLSALMRDPDEPITFQQALDSPESQQWESAMQSELKTLEENDTWTITEPPIGARVLRGKWVYKIKRPSNRPIRYKARWVVKGFEQIYGQDYDQTFAGVVKASTLKILWALAAT